MAILLGLTIGAFINWGVIARRLRIYTEIAKDSITIPAYFENRFHDNKGMIRSLTAVVVVIFFTNISEQVLSLVEYYLVQCLVFHIIKHYYLRQQ